MNKCVRKAAGSVLSALLLTGFWTGSSGAVECVSLDLSVSCHRTIQEAVLAADPGEEVAVYPGFYAENVTVDTPGVQVVGQGRQPGEAVIDAGGGVAVSLNAPHAALKNVTVKNGDTGIVVMGAGAVIDDVQVSDCSRGIAVSADAVLVMGTAVHHAAGRGIEVAGDGFIARSLVVQQSGEACIDVSGDGARVEKSRMVDCGSEGVKISGSAALVLQNELRVTGGHMIFVQGPGAVIQDNDLEGGRSAAIRVFSDPPIVVNNSARDCDSGIDVFCDFCAGGRVVGNVARGTYNCPGFIVEAASAGLEVRSNTSRDSSDQGFSLSGVGMVVRDNVAFDNGADGFDVYSSTDVQILGNKAFKNSWNGIRLGSSVTGTQVKKNRAHNNGDADLYDAGIGTILGTGSSRNSFGTVGGP